MGVRAENTYPLEQAWDSFPSMKSFWVSTVYQVLDLDVNKNKSHPQRAHGLMREKDT